MKRSAFIKKSIGGVVGLGVLKNTALFAGPSIVKASNLIGTKIHHFASKGPLNHSSNSYFIETPDGIFVIDAQWTLSEAQNALAFIRKKSDKPFLGLLITHDHTDHYGGTSVFMEETQGDLMVYASEITKLSIKNDAHGFQKNRKKNFGNDFPDEPIIPTHIVHNNETLNIGVLKFEILERPNNEATSTSLVFSENLNGLITGDIVYDKTYAIFREGISGIENWKLQLEGLLNNFGDAKLYPGHGNPRLGAAIISEQIDFLLAFKNPIVKSLDRYGEVTSSVRNSMLENIPKQFPKHKSIIGLSKEVVINQSIDWLSQELDKN